MKIDHAGPVPQSSEPKQTGLLENSLIEIKDTIMQMEAEFREGCLQMRSSQEQTQVDIQQL